MFVLETAAASEFEESCPISDRSLVDTISASDLADAIDLLSAEERLLLSLFYHEGLTLSEVALVLDQTPADTVSAHARALTQLRGRLDAGHQEGTLSCGVGHW